MKPFAIATVLLSLAAANCASLRAQTLTPRSGDKAEAAALETLIKKIDEQNMKIDALSQHILKLDQQVAAIRPGVMIGDTTPSVSGAAPGASAAPASPAVATPAGNAHVVAKGETLISIAKTHKVGVEELQKFNHIEDARKLQAGQTLMIPTPGGSPAASPSPTPNG